MFKRLSIFVLVLMLGLSGCADNDLQSKRMVENTAKKLFSQSAPRTVVVTPNAYFGAKASTPSLESKVPELSEYITLRRNATLSELVEMISQMSSIPVSVTPSQMGDAAQAGGGGASTSSKYNISYEGPLSGLLDQISEQTDMVWTYNPVKRTIAFDTVGVRVFTLNASPAASQYTASLSNTSGTAEADTADSGNVESSTESDQTTSDVSQNTQLQYNMNPWAEIGATVQQMLSPIGRVAVSIAAGTVTVRDTYRRLQEIEAYIEKMNAKLSRQVALTVRVYQLAVNDNVDRGISLKAIFNNAKLAIAAGSPLSFSNGGTATVTILKGKLGSSNDSSKQSSGILDALNRWGHAVQLTSAGGILMNNQALPVLAIKQHTYVAGQTKETTEYGQDTTLTPGSINEGFSMSVTPHILDNQRVVLQYNVTLSELDNMNEVDADDTYIQLPEVSTRAFAQSSQMKVGQTLVLAGFEQRTSAKNKRLGILDASHSSEYEKTVLVITIELDAAEV